MGGGLQLRRRGKLGLVTEESDAEGVKLGNCNKSLAPSVTCNKLHEETKIDEESIAAAALLLFLSHPPSPPSLLLSYSSSSSSSCSSASSFRNGELKKEASISIADEEASASSASASCISDASSSLTQAAGDRIFSTAEADAIHGDPLRVLALAAATASLRASIRPKLVKKARSKRKRQIREIYKMRVVYDLLDSKGSKDVDDDGPSIFSLPAAAHTATAVTPAASSSVVTAVANITRRSSSMRDKNARSSSPATTVTKAIATKNRASRSVKRRADAIVDWLSRNGCASEVKIRSVVGDSPDTSKALRLLVKKEEVKRTGAGGRSDPFLYTVASKGMTQSGL